MILVIAAAVLVALAQAQTAQAATKKATAARRNAAALLEAKSQADDAAAKALVELDRVRGETTDQLEACRSSSEQAQNAAQRAIADRDRILAERTAELRRQIEQAKADARAQVKAIQDKADAAKAEADQLVKTLRDELAGTANAATRAASDQPTVVQQPAHAELAAARPRDLTGRRTPKMTPALVVRAQQMYDSGRYTVPEIAQSCAVSPTTIYRHIHTGRTTSR